MNHGPILTFTKSSEMSDMHACGGYNSVFMKDKLKVFFYLSKTELGAGHQAITICIATTKTANTNQ